MGRKGGAPARLGQGPHAAAAALEPAQEPNEPADAADDTQPPSDVLEAFKEFKQKLHAPPPQATLDKQKKDKLTAVWAWLPALYDTHIQYSPTVPSGSTPLTYSVDFLPGWFNVSNGWGEQLLLSGCEATEEDPYGFKVLQLRLPYPHTHPGTSAASLSYVQLHPSVGDVYHHRLRWEGTMDVPNLADADRIRHMPQQPGLVAVKCLDNHMLLVNINHLLPKSYPSHTQPSQPRTASEDPDSAFHTPRTQADEDTAMDVDGGSNSDPSLNENEEDADFDGALGPGMGPVALLGSPDCQEAVPEGYGFCWHAARPGLLLSSCAGGAVHAVRLDADHACAARRGEDGSLVYLGASQLYCNGHEKGVVNDIAIPHAEGSLSHDLFVSVGEEGALVGWDMRAHTDRPVLTRTGLHRGAIHAVDFSPSQPYTLATGGKDGRVVALDMRALGRPSPSQDPGTQGCGVMHTLETCKGRGYPQQASIEQVAFSPHHSGCVAVGDVDGRVMLWDVSNNTHTQQTQNTGPAQASASKPAKNKLFSLPQTKFIHGGHASKVDDLRWSPNPGAPLLASCSCEWSPEDWDMDKPYQGHVVQVWTPSREVVGSWLQ